MKIRTAQYEQGTAKHAEDRLIIEPPRFYGVVDGVSGVYGSEGPKMFSGGLTGGQVAGNILVRAFAAGIHTEAKTDRIFAQANKDLRTVCENNKIPLDQAHLFPAATFVIAEINEKHITLYQASDSLAVWETKNGTFDGTPNLFFPYEQNRLRIIAKLMDRHKGDRKKMWEEFCPILADLRRKEANVAYCIFNGQSAFDLMIQRFVLELNNIRRLILFTDGLVPFEETRDIKTLARKLMELYAQDGVSAVLSHTREVAKANQTRSHEDYAEASVIVLEA